MEYLYLWGIHPSRGLVVLGPYEGERDEEYKRRRNILAASGISPNIKWLGTRDQAAATQIIKHGVMGQTGDINMGLNRARHDIKNYSAPNTSADIEVG